MLEVRAGVEQIVALQAVGDGLAAPELRAERAAQLAECRHERQMLHLDPALELLVGEDRADGSGSPGTTSRCL